VDDWGEGKPDTFEGQAPQPPWEALVDDWGEGKPDTFEGQAPQPISLDPARGEGPSTLRGNPL
ncbi:hypothetical protein T484DRAFT_1836409, partial [Baffinella frigidus]